MSEEVDLKKVGLDIAEDAVKSVISRLVKPLAVKYIAASPNKIDDILLPFVDSLEAELLKMADKIDGEVG